MFGLTLPAVVLASEILAMVNGKPVTRADLEAVLNEATRQSYHDALADLRDDEHAAVRDWLGRESLERSVAEQHVPADSVYARTMAGHFDQLDPNLRHKIQTGRARIYELEHAAIEAVVQQRLFESVARARHMTPEELTHALERSAPPASRQDLAFIRAYEASKEDVSATLPPGEQRLEAAIHAARVQQLRAALVDSARGRSMVGSRLEPPRVAVSTRGASIVGSASAPVHVVVFTDFECPYCYESERTLAAIREQYGDRVALYYLNYPLPNHAHARPAAIAAMCAAAQGRYLAYHDLLFAHREDLAHADYPGWAASIGLDRAKFEACMAGGDPDRQVDRDIREGIAAGLTSTPMFVTNGRVSTDTDTLLQQIAEELGAAK
jgi:protein-disulfide isomerase